MIRAAVEVLPDTRVAAVTLLTSLSEDDVSAIGFGGSPRYVVRQLAALAVAAGARAIVCSPAEVADVRREVGPDVVLVTPGVRVAGSAPGGRIGLRLTQRLFAWLPCSR
jgi:orotidine-5'-phosphate decarboxylase